ncbi:MAG: hypothetical protein IKL89_03460 [Clostridia bacterium]|nr:hypothetical protein [Clostridia bacterium]
MRKKTYRRISALLILALLCLFLSACTAEPAESDIGGSSIESVSSSEIQSENAVRPGGSIYDEVGYRFYSEEELQEGILGKRENGSGELPVSAKMKEAVKLDKLDAYWRLKDPVGAYTQLCAIEVWPSYVEWIYKKPGVGGIGRVYVRWSRFSGYGIGIPEQEAGFYYEETGGEVVFGFYPGDGRYIRVATAFTEEAWELSELKNYCKAEKVGVK